MNNIVRNNIYALKILFPQKITHSFVIDANLQKIVPHQFCEVKSAPVLIPQKFHKDMLTPKMKYLVELMNMFSTRQMGYFDMLQSAKGF